MLLTSLILCLGGPRGQGVCSPMPEHRNNESTGKESGLAALCFGNWSLGSFGVLWLRNCHGKLELVGF